MKASEIDKIDDILDVLEVIRQALMHGDKEVFRYQSSLAGTLTSCVMKPLERMKIDGAE